MGGTAVIAYTGAMANYEGQKPGMQSFFAAARTFGKHIACESL